MSTQNTSNSAATIHKIHPSIYNMTAAGTVANSPFLRNKQAPPKASSDDHKTEPSEEEQQLEKLHTTQQSVYVLDKAKLAEQGIDFWENKQEHSRVNTEWWLQQLRQRQLIKQQQQKDNPSMSVARKTNKQSMVRFADDEEDDDDDGDEVEESVTVVEQSVIYHDQEPLRHEAQPTALFGGTPDMDMNEEFESLLKDYRDASVRLLQSESDKKQTMLVLNEQKDMIDAQNGKMQELERQLNVFESMLQKLDDNSVDHHELIEKFEQSLASSSQSQTDEHLMRVNITQEITQKVNEDFNRKLQLNEMELDALRQRLQDKEDTEARLKTEMETRQKATNDQLSAITQQLQQTQQQNQALLHAVSDLKHEVEQQRNASQITEKNSGDADDSKQSKLHDDDDTDGDVPKSAAAGMQQHNVVINNNNYSLNRTEQESARELLSRQNNNGNGNDDDEYDDNEDDNVPLLDGGNGGKQFGRTPRQDTTKKYIGLQPKEFFLKNGWCCGFVCCDTACGCGAY